MKMSKWILTTIVLLSLVAFNLVFAADACIETFEVLDVNKNNALTYDEFIKLEHLKKIPFADMKELNGNKDGIVTFEETCKRMFDKADKNRNGEIDRKEWKEFYNSILQQ